MQFKYRLSMTLILMSTFSLMLFLVLMYFHYHSARMNWIYERFKVDAQTVSSYVTPLVKNDLFVHELKANQEKEVLQKINTVTEQLCLLDSFIHSIHVFQIFRDHTVAILNKRSLLGQDVNLEINRQARQYKDVFFKGKFFEKKQKTNDKTNGKKNYIGLIIRNAQGIPQFCILIVCDPSFINKDEFIQLKDIYIKSLLFFMILIVLSFCIGFRNSIFVNQYAKAIKSYFENIKSSPSTKFDLKEIDDYTLREQLRETLSLFSSIHSNISKIENLLEETSDKESNQSNLPS